MTADNTKLVDKDFDSLFDTVDIHDLHRTAYIVNNRNRNLFHLRDQCDRD
jgi:hypothetical protein